MALVASNSSITSLTVNGARALGFNASQTSNADIQINLHNGQQFAISLKGSSTLSAAINQIENGTDGLVTVAIDTVNKCLDLADSTSGPETFSVTALNDSLAGAPQVGLGLVGTETDGGGIIQGASLSGDSIANHLFLSNVSVQGGVTISAAANNNISGTASLGVVDIAISGGTASGSVQSSISTTAGMRISIPDFPTAFSSLTPTVTGNATLTLPATVADAVLPSLTSQTQTPTTLAVNWTPNSVGLNVTNPGTASDLLQLVPSSTGTPGPVLTAFNDVIGSLLTMDESSDLSGAFPLSAELPLLDESVSDLITNSSVFSQDLGQVSTGSQTSLDTLVAALEQALSATVEVTLDTTGNSPALEFQVVFTPPSYSGQAPVNIDVSQLLIQSDRSAYNDLSGITNLDDPTGQTNFSVTANGALNLDLGIALTNSGQPQAFLYNSTSLDLQVDATATDMTYATDDGGAFAEQGQAAISADGTTSGSPASFDLTVAGPNGRYYFSQGSTPFTSSVTGKVGLQLPLYTTSTTSSPVGDSTANHQYSDGVTVPANVFSVNVPNLSAELQSGPDSVEIDTPNLSNLTPQQFNLTTSASTLVGGLGTLFKGLQNSLSTQLSANSLPLIGNQLAGAIQNAPDFFNNLAGNPVSELRSMVNSQISASETPGGTTITTAMLQSDFFQVLGPSGANVLGTLAGGVFTSAGLSAIESVLDANRVEFDLPLAQTKVLSVPFETAFGGLSLTGEVDLTVSYSVTLGFGIDSTNGFYMADPTTPLSVSVNANLASLNLNGQLDGVSVSVIDEKSPVPLSGFQSADQTALAAVGDDPTQHATLLNGVFTVNLDPSSQSRLYLSNPASLTQTATLASLAQNSTAQLTGFADVQLQMAFGQSTGGSNFFSTGFSCIGDSKTRARAPVILVQRPSSTSTTLRSVSTIWFRRGPSFSCNTSTTPWKSP